MSSNVDPELQKIQNILEQLEQAIRDHNRWLMEWHRALVCRVPLQHQHMANDAHRHCEFGKWYHSQEHAYLAHFPEFIEIEQIHATMHNLARSLLHKSISNEPLSLIEYDDCLKSRGEFRELVWTLEKKLRNTILYTDPLTNIANRHEMIPCLTQYRDRQSSSVVCMSDLDHFKQVNDTHGHTIGDQVLMTVARFFSSHLRPLDIIFRYGGDEFLIVLVDVNLAMSETVVDRLRALLANQTIVVDSQYSLNMTASFGLAVLDPELDVEETIARADQALYAAKEKGRNRVCSLMPDGIKHVTPGAN